jgi:hypothetical protein
MSGSRRRIPLFEDPNLRREDEKSERELGVSCTYRELVTCACS